MPVLNVTFRRKVVAFLVSALVSVTKCARLIAPLLYKSAVRPPSVNEPWPSRPCAVVMYVMFATNLRLGGVEINPMLHSTNGSRNVSLQTAHKPSWPSFSWLNGST